MMLYLFAVCTYLSDVQPKSEIETENFVIHAADEKAARQIAEAAEAYRRQLAELWLGKPLPKWRDRITLRVTISAGPVSGSSTFTFGDKKVLQQSMEMQGPLKEVLDNTLPHELTHVILAGHFRRPVPRWADEGCAMHVESAAEIDRRRRLWKKLRTAPDMHLIPLEQFFAIREYPSHIREFYAESAALVRFLLHLQPRATLLKFIDHGETSWNEAVREHYGYKNVKELERAWLFWEGQPNARPGLVVRIGQPLGTFSPLPPPTFLPANPK